MMKLVVRNVVWGYDSLVQVTKRQYRSWTVGHWQQYKSTILISLCTKRLHKAEKMTQAHTQLQQAAFSSPARTFQPDLVNLNIKFMFRFGVQFICKNGLWERCVSYAHQRPFLFLFGALFILIFTRPGSTFSLAFIICINQWQNGRCSRIYFLRSVFTIKNRQKGRNLQLSPRCADLNMTFDWLQLTTDLHATKSILTADAFWEEQRKVLRSEKSAEWPSNAGGLQQAAWC